MAESYSGLDPIITYSNLQPSGSGFSGASQGASGLSGLGGGGVVPGMLGGLDLAQLSALIQAANAAGTGEGVGVGGDILQSLGAGALGQQQGGLGAGSFGQQGGYTAGQASGGGGMSGAGGYTAGQGSGGDIDPLSIAAKVLGIGSKLAGAVGTASPSNTAGETITENTPPELIAALGQQNASDLYGGAAGGYTPYAQQTLERFGLSPEEANRILEEQRNTLLYGGPDLPGYNPELGANTTQQGISAPGGAGGGISGATSSTNYLGAAQGGLGSLLGLLNLYQGIQGGNPQQGISGGLQGAGGLATLLKSSPELASALGIPSSALGTLGTGLGAAGSALGLYGGIQSMLNGQYGPGATQLAGALVSAYPAIAQGVNALGGALPAAAGGLAGIGASLGPAGLVAAGDPYGGGGAGVAATGAALASGVGAGIAAPLAPIVAFLVDYFGNQEEVNARRSGWWNNPIIGNLYERAVQGATATNTLADQIRQAGMQNIGTRDLMGALYQAQQGLFPYYERAQGGAGAVAGSQAAGSPGMLSKEEYGALGDRATQNVYELINELNRRGVTAQQLGAIPAGTSKWGETYLGGSAVQGNRVASPENMWGGQAYTQGGLPMSGYDPGLAAIQSGSWLSPANVNTVTGGPTLSMLAALNPELYGQVGGAYNYSDPAVQAELARQQAYANMINAQAYAQFTSGGN
ncbi:MAG TPA: hypothetical protein VGX03_15095 [Candidatus Binatia bacterium]|jgi:hypothetical protein|nr:hypothetical protein [Candidatus Binatia bacterium]